MYSSTGQTLALFSVLFTIVGIVVSVLLVIAVLRMWHHTAAMRRELEAIRASVAPMAPMAPPRQMPPAAPQKPKAF